MSFHFNIFSVTLLMSGVITLLIAVLMAQQSTNMVKWFVAMMSCIALWAIAYSFELASHTLGQILFWINVEYVGISFLPAMWIFFTIKFIGRDEWLGAVNRFTILFFPVTTLALVWTNAIHHLHYEQVRVDSGGPFPMLDIIPGPWYHVHTIYFYFMLALGIGLLVYKFRDADIAFRRQSRTILLAAGLPWLVNFLYLAGVRPFRHIDLTPYAFIITVIAIAYGLFRYRLFNVIPLAREKVVEEIREGILVLDKQGRVIDMNRAMKGFLPPFLTEPMGESIIDILPGHDALLQLMKQPTGTRAELEVNRRFYEVGLTRLNERRAGGGMTLIFWDITERRFTLHKIAQQARELAELNQVKDRLFSIVAHDLRSPISNLSSMLSMVEDNTITREEFDAILPTLSRNVSYTSAMLENLLYWATSQLEGYSVKPMKFDLGAMVHDKLALFERRAADKGISLSNDIPKVVTVFSDPDMTGIVLRNLISNAVKFCKAKDVISVSAKVNCEKVTVCVSDTGSGIGKELADKLFSSERVSTKGTANEKGTGLGLKLCKEFTEKNGGKFWLESIPGKGSKFFFEIKRDAIIPS